MSAVEMLMMGKDEVIRELQRYQKAFPLETRDALHEEALEIEAASVPLVPVKFARLRNSRSVIVQGLLDPQVVISYDTEYAVYVHERLDLKHPVGEAKFLEKPFKRSMRGFDRRLVFRIRKKVRIR